MERNNTERIHKTGLRGIVEVNFGHFVAIRYLIVQIWNAIIVYHDNLLYLNIFLPELLFCIGTSLYLIAFSIYLSISNKVILIISDLKNARTIISFHFVFSFPIIFENGSIHKNRNPVFAIGKNWPIFTVSTNKFFFLKIVSQLNNFL